ncbi:unnamed protein product [Caenorhabditis auriculariae]|uniref:Tyrosine-protein phosphatase domain-containing protein n=1 Tax=Caenorhabditis auriculariae TaxID=2777116 RepID=A0A8S1GT41_9PELO|nr:unnamed protein product [Caenorhabditis auriculariae]
MLKSLRIIKKKNKDAVETSTRKKKDKDKKPKAVASTVECSQKKNTPKGVASNVEVSQRKRKAKKKDEEKTINSMRARMNSNEKVETGPPDFAFAASVHPSTTEQTPGQKQAFEQFITKIKNMGIDGLIKEYNAEVKPYIVPNMRREVFDKNVEKNRYVDVVCNDTTRVVLKDGRPGDYIHANYVRGLTPTYILTQGPLAGTCVDFWRMIAQEKVTMICMLCEFVEMGKTKCEKYYPDAANEKMTHGDFTVTCESVDTTDQHFHKCNLLVESGGTKWKTTHWRMKTWPDKTVPKSPMSVLRCLLAIRTSQNAVVVHCSAGIGRTGTFTAVEICLQTVFNGKILVMYEICQKLRSCRPSCVQVDQQYIALALTVCECAFAFKYVTDPTLNAEITAMKEKYLQYVATGQPSEGVSQKPSNTSLATAPATAVTTTTATQPAQSPSKGEKKKEKNFDLTVIFFSLPLPRFFFPQKRQ